MDNTKIETSTERLNDDEALRRQVAAGGMGCATFWFVKRCMRDPALRERIQARAAEIRANGEYGLGQEEAGTGCV